MAQAAPGALTAFRNISCISRMFPTGNGKGSSHFLLKFDSAPLEPSQFALHIAIFLHPISSVSPSSHK